MYRWTNASSFINEMGISSALHCWILNSPSWTMAVKLKLVSHMPKCEIFCRKLHQLFGHQTSPKNHALDLCSLIIFPFLCSRKYVWHRERSKKSILSTRPRHLKLSKNCRFWPSRVVGLHPNVWPGPTSFCSRTKFWHRDTHRKLYKGIPYKNTEKLEFFDSSAPQREGEFEDGSAEINGQFQGVADTFDHCREIRT